MKKFSNEFRPALREMRQLNAIVSYHDPKGFYILTTEDDDNLLTENEFEIATESGVIDYDKETINSVNPLFNASLFKTTCKSIQIECKNKIPIGTYLKVEIGVYKPNEDKYEYLDYGDYLVNEEPVYQADSNDYLVTGYDKMIESMINYDDNPLSITFPIKHKNFVIAICDKFNWKYNLIDYPNANKNIVKDFYKGQNLTYRDVLDDLNGACGGSFMFDLNNNLIWKRPTETNEIVEDDDLKDVNVDFSEKYGKVNALTITTNGNVVLDSKEDSQSIQENGKAEFNINDNYILSYSTSDFIDEMFDEVNGLEYYLYDVDSTGLLIFEALDMFTFRHNGIDYKTIMLNDDIKLTQGLVETTFAEKPKETKNDYITTDKEKNKLNNAIISLDKANAEIVLKVDSNGRISQVRLDGNADSGSVIEINADQINLTADDILNLIAGNTINLTAKNIEIDSTNFKVDKDGNMTAKSGTFEGTVNTDKDLTVGNNAYIGQNQASSSDVQKYLYFSNNAWIRRWIFPNTGGNYLRIQSDLNTGLACGSGHIYVLDGSIQMSHQPIIESDKRLKQKIKNIDVSFINDIKIKEFEYINTPGKKQIGVIAQDYINKEYSKYFLNKNLNDNGEEYYSVSYGNITNALIKYCQEMNKQIETLQNQVNELKEMINNGKYKD